MRISDWNSDVCSSDLEGAQEGSIRHRTAHLVDDVFHAVPDVEHAAAAIDNETAAGLARRPAAHGAGVGYDQPGALDQGRPDERRGGNECVSTCQSWWSPTPSKQNKQKRQPTNT